MGRYPVEGSGPDCKSGGLRLGWFDPNPAHQNSFTTSCAFTLQEYKQEGRMRSVANSYAI